jgi:hypothetical protein
MFMLVLVRRIAVSPKYNSLAYDTTQEQILDEGFEPQLSVIVTGHNGKVIDSISSTFKELSDEVVRITGRITVSF